MSRFVCTRDKDTVFVTVANLVGSPDEYEFTLADARSLAFAINNRKQRGSFMVQDRLGREFRWAGNTKEAEAFSARLHAVASATVPTTAAGQPYP